MKSLVAMAFVAFVSVPAFGAEESVSIPSGPGQGSGFLVTPATAGPAPAVIVIQEWWA